MLAISKVILGMVADPVEHWSQVRKIVDSNPWINQTNDLSKLILVTSKSVPRHYWDRASTGWLSIRIVWLSGYQVMVLMAWYKVAMSALSQVGTLCDMTLDVART